MRPVLGLLRILYDWALTLFKTRTFPFYGYVFTVMFVCFFVELKETFGETDLGVYFAFV